MGSDVIESESLFLETVGTKVAWESRVTPSDFSGSAYIFPAQEVPRHTRLHSRGNTRVLPTSRGALFPPASSRGGILSLRVRERIPGVPVASQEEALSTGKVRGTPGSCHHSPTEVT